MEGNFEENADKKKNWDEDSTLFKKNSKEDVSGKECVAKGDLNCMRTYTVDSKCELYVYGKYIANKLRNTGRSCQEMSIVQHHLEQMCFNLIMGAYSHNNILYLPLDSGANFLGQNL
jgi:hypothetical protein